MKSELKEPVYFLAHDEAHFEYLGLDWDEDILFRKFDGYRPQDFWENKLFAHPTPVKYKGTLQIVKHIDFPVADNGWTVMSRRMLDILLSVGDFPHRSIPVVIESTDPVNLAEEADMILEDYVAVQITERTGVLDGDKSVTFRDEEQNNEIFVVKYAFIPPAEGFPPLFMIPENYAKVFISDEARSALKKAEITGVRYVSLNDFDGQRQRETVDTKISLPESIFG